ncbi:MAG: M23 family metallopeptidase [Candidatus Glassbacteria bacterium]|nr:M23 family metallopeptidase [Candidatus Glassbacteria bacterium]
MPRKAWTILFVPHGDISIRRLSVSRWLIGFLSFCCLTLAVGVGYLVISSVNKTYNELKLINLEQENRLLTEKLNTVESKIGQLNGKIDGLLVENQVFRRIAGLEVLDEEVTKVGIGGTFPGHYDELFEMDSELAKNIYSQEDQVEALLRKADLIGQSLQEAMESMEASADKWAHHPSIKPTTGYISSFFGRRRHPIYHTLQYHNAIDISTKTGEPIVATADGKIIKSSHQVGYGLTIVIDHGYGINTKYAHCSKSKVRKGQKVKRGEVIGYVGQSGITTGPNLHYEVVENGVPKDPLNYILDNYVP